MNSSMATPNERLQKSAYVCDTLPAAKLAIATGPEAISSKPERSPSPNPQSILRPVTKSPPHPPVRKLCVRHKRMADEGTNLKLQQSLDALPLEEREAVNNIWSNFSSSSHGRRAIILHGLLTMCCFSQLSLLTEQLAHLIRIDPFAVLPREISLKILKYMDATSLCRAAQVSKKWRSLADDDILWRDICEQHIGQRCHKCGWGLPILERKRTFRTHSASPQPSSETVAWKRPRSEALESCAPPSKRSKSVHHQSANELDHATLEIDHHPLIPPASPRPLPLSVTRPWKDVYSERMTIECNWRRSRYTQRTLKGHTDGVMCLQFNENLQHPAFPVLITGSYDRTTRVWNMETGVELQCLRGHGRAIRALQFDEVKLITASMDNTLKIWDWRRGRCIRTLNGHTDGVVCLNFDSNVLVSGSVDTTVKVWNIRTGGAFTLRGHSDWVNSVALWDTNSSSPTSPTFGTPLFDVPGCAQPQIDPGKMLFSASDDGTIRLWDLTQRACIRQFIGHVGQVQSLKLLYLDLNEQNVQGSHITDLDASLDETSTKYSKPCLISGSLDNTIKIWDIDSGSTIRTFFGHIEGVWSVAADRMRLVSGSHDRTVKVWSREEGNCTATLIGHRAAVSCVALGEDKIVSGSDDSDVIVWSFGG